MAAHGRVLGEYDMLTRQFLTVREVADLLKVGEVTVRHWIKGGDLRAIDVGREWRIAPGDLELFLRRHATTAKSTAEAPPQASVHLHTEGPATLPNAVKAIPAGKRRAD